MGQKRKAYIPITTVISSEDVLFVSARPIQDHTAIFPLELQFMDIAHMPAMGWQNLPVLSIGLMNQVQYYM